MLIKKNLGYRTFVWSQCKFFVYSSLTLVCSNVADRAWLHFLAVPPGGREQVQGGWGGGQLVPAGALQPASHPQRWSSPSDIEVRRSLFPPVSIIAPSKYWRPLPCETVHLRWVESINIPLQIMTPYTSHMLAYYVEFIVNNANNSTIYLVLLPICSLFSGTYLTYLTFKE